MQFLRIRKRKNADKAQAFVIKKNRKYGEVLSQECISVKRHVLICGAHGAGKTYWLKRLVENRPRIWCKSKGHLRIDAQKPLSSWADDESVADWWNKSRPDDTEWKKLKAPQRQDNLPLFLVENKAVLFIDDAHLLTGRKLQVARDCVRAASIFVLTASDEGRLAPGLRHEVLKLQPQVFRLTSDVAYDATPFIMWLVVFFCITLGQWEIAGVLGGLTALSRGRRATKQN